MKFTGMLPPQTTKPLYVPPTMSDNGHWVFPEKMGEKGYVGFVYAIFDTVLNRGYIGKKNFKIMRGKDTGKESNWRTYKSSATVLATHFAERPSSEFEFICLEQYKTKGGLSYAETWSLCSIQAPTSPAWYNTRIEGVSWSVKEGVSARHQNRLMAVSKKVIL